MRERLPTSVLGRTGLKVTRLGYGAMEVSVASRGGLVTEEEASGILNAVLDAGINFIDTSIDYGRSEELVGKYISRRRSEFFLASKCGCPLGPDPSTGEHLRGGLVCLNSAARFDKWNRAAVR